MVDPDREKKRNNSAGLAFFLAVFCTIFTAAGQILWKMGLLKTDSSWTSFFNLPFIIGFVFYGVGSLLLVLAFKKGELSLIYPIIAIGYVWVSLLSPYFFGDTMNLWKWLGVVIIIISISLLGWGNIPNRKTNLERKND